MAELLTESFCERCGTRYTFESAAGRGARLKGIRVMSRGLRNFVMSDDSSIDEAMAAARNESEREQTSQQLEAFHKTFNFCMECRQYTCANCWNETDNRCLSCAPIGADFAPGMFGTVAGGGALNVTSAEAIELHDRNGHDAPTLVSEPLAWPTSDLMREAEAPIEPAFAEPVSEAPVELVETEVPEPIAAEAHDLFAAEPDEAVATEPDEAVAAESDEAVAEDLPVVADVPAEPFKADLAWERIKAEAAGVVPFVDEPASSVDEVEPIDFAARLEAVSGPVRQADALPVAEPAAERPWVEQPAEPEMPEPSVIAAAEAPEAPVVDAWPVEALQAAPSIDAVAPVDMTPEPDIVEVADDHAAVASANTSDLLQRFRPGQSLDDEIEAYERSHAAADAVEPEPEPVVAVEPEPVVAEPEPEPVVAVELEPVVAVEPELEPVVVALEPEPVLADEPQPVVTAPKPVVAEQEAEPIVAEPVVAPEPEPVVAEPVVALEPEPVLAIELEPEPLVVAPEPEPVVAVELEPEPVVVGPEPEPESVVVEPEPEPVAAAYEPEPEPVVVEAEPEPRPIVAASEVGPEPEPRTDFVPQPTWQIVAPDSPTADGATAPPVQQPPAQPPADAVAASAEPQWPDQPQWPGREAAAGLPFLGRAPAATGGIEALWAASAQEVAQVPATETARVRSGIQPCVSCGLSLSANARFCRRCGTRQA